MPHRDPETGQFTSDMMMAEHYDDLVFQHVTSGYTIEASDLPGSFPVSEEDINVVGLDDLLDRHERADLIAVQVNSLQATIPGTSSAESGLQTRFELRAGVGSEMVTDGDRDQTVDAGSSGVVNKRIWESDSPDVLYHAHWIADASFNDSAGNAGGADQPVLDSDRHFPREFGTCPQFDDRDEITESFYVNDTGSADISDSLIVIKVSYTLVFDVHERD